MPCKHIFALMDHIEYVSWLSFSEKYSQSPFLRLDNTVINKDGISNQPIDDSILENNIEKSKDKKTIYNEWKKRIFIKRLDTSSSL